MVGDGSPALPSVPSVYPPDCPWVRYDASAERVSLTSFGLAASQKAADVLTGEGVRAANTSKWLATLNPLTGGYAKEATPSGNQGPGIWSWWTTRGSWLDRVPPAGHRC